MNCKFDIAVSQITEKFEEFERADDGLAALTGLLDTGAIRISTRNEATVRALRQALNERWHMLQTYKQAAVDDFVKTNGLPFDEGSNS